jgi:hypothetical protein
MTCIAIKARGLRVKPDDPVICGSSGLGSCLHFVLQNTVAEIKPRGGPCGRNGRLPRIRNTRHHVLNTAGNGFKVLFREPG